MIFDIQVFFSSFSFFLHAARIPSYSFFRCVHTIVRSAPYPDENLTRKMFACNRTVSPDLYESPPLVTDNAPRRRYILHLQIPSNLSVLASPYCILLLRVSSPLQCLLYARQSIVERNSFFHSIRND